MKNWKIFKIGDKKAETACETSKEIVEKLGSKLEAFFKLKLDGEKTQHIFDALTVLGTGKKDSRGEYFRCLSNRISKELVKKLVKKRVRKGEWLFDLHWYTEKGTDSNTFYQPERLHLVVECEWGLRRPNDTLTPKDPFGAVKWDFQKLLVSNADLRLMIFKERRRNKDENDNLDIYFREAIESYETLEPGSRFLFVAFGTQEFYYTEKDK